MTPSMKRSLAFGSLATAVFGVAFAGVAVLAPGALESLYRLLGPGTPTEVGPAAQLATGIYGGLMAGWGTSFYLVGRGVSFGKAGAIGLATWYVVDSAASIAVGYPLNAVSNLAFLLPFAPFMVGASTRQRQTA